jgi:hypothetical protein
LCYIGNLFTMFQLCIIFLVVISKVDLCFEIRLE